MVKKRINRLISKVLSINWSHGEVKTMYFQIKVQDTTEEVSVKAGGTSYGPMSVTAQSVPNSVNFVDMDA